MREFTEARTQLEVMARSPVCLKDRAEGPCQVLRQENRIEFNSSLEKSNASFQKGVVCEEMIKFAWIMVIGRGGIVD